MKILSNKLSCAVAGGRSGSEKEDNQAAATPLKDPTYTPATSTTQSALKDPSNPQHSINAGFSVNNMGGKSQGVGSVDYTYKYNEHSSAQMSAGADSNGRAQASLNFAYTW